MTQLREVTGFPRSGARAESASWPLMHARTIWAIGAISLTVAALTSCSGGSSDAATSAASSPTSAPPTTVVSALGPQDKYFFISSAYNDVHSDVLAQFAHPDGSIDADHAIEFCAALAPADEQFAADIQAASWPADAQDEAAALAQAVAGDAAVLHGCAKASSGDAAQKIIGAHDWKASSNAESALRVALGLPSDS